MPMILIRNFENWSCFSATAYCNEWYSFFKYQFM